MRLKCICPLSKVQNEAFAADLIINNYQGHVDVVLLPTPIRKKAVRNFCECFCSTKTFTNFTNFPLTKYLKILTNRFSFLAGMSENNSFVLCRI